jgi:hypothetical protein
MATPARRWSLIPSRFGFVREGFFGIRVETAEKTLAVLRRDRNVLTEIHASVKHVRS